MFCFYILFFVWKVKLPWVTPSVGSLERKRGPRVLNRPVWSLLMLWSRTPWGAPLWSRMLSSSWSGVMILYSTLSICLRIAVWNWATLPNRTITNEDYHLDLVPWLWPCIHLHHWTVHTVCRWSGHFDCSPNSYGIGQCDCMGYSIIHCGFIMTKILNCWFFVDNDFRVILFVT